MELLPKDEGRVAQHAVGSCGHYLQFGAAHGHCVKAQESRERSKNGKKQILQGFLLTIWKGEVCSYRRMRLGLSLPARIAIRTERPVQ